MHVAGAHTLALGAPLALRNRLQPFLESLAK